MSNKKPLMSRDPLAQVEDQDNAASPSSDGLQAAGGAAGPVALPPTLTIADAGEFHAVLEGVLHGAVPVTLDGSSVESVDGAGLQLLAGFIKSADESSLPVSWCGASERLREAAAIVGLGGVLHFDTAGPAA
jgi:anti-anti-sigma regulatory factor